jgi:hypothetical protein
MTRIHSSNTFARAFGLSVAEKDRSMLAADKKLGGTSGCIIFETDTTIEHTVAFVQHCAEDSVLLATNSNEFITKYRPQDGRADYKRAAWCTSPSVQSVFSSPTTKFGRQ